LHAKLDELLRVDNRARSELTQLDEHEPEVIEAHGDQEVRSASSGHSAKIAGVPATLAILENCIRLRASCAC
jgi:low affinity Fe/Cu permease